MHQRPLRTIYNNLSLTNSTPVIAATIRWRTENPVRNWRFSFLFHRKKYNPLLLPWPFGPPNILYTLYLIYTLLIPWLLL